MSASAQAAQHCAMRCMPGAKPTFHSCSHKRQLHVTAARQVICMACTARLAGKRPAQNYARTYICSETSLKVAKGQRQLALLPTSQIKSKKSSTAAWHTKSTEVHWQWSSERRVKLKRQRQSQSFKKPVPARLRKGARYVSGQPKRRRFAQWPPMPRMH